MLSVKLVVMFEYTCPNPLYFVSERLDVGFVYSVELIYWRLSLLFGLHNLSSSPSGFRVSNKVLLYLCPEICGIVVQLIRKSLLTDFSVFIRNL